MRQPVWGGGRICHDTHDHSRCGSRSQRFFGPGAAQSKVTISISCSSLGIELELCQEGADAWAKETGNKVKLVSTPARANERLALYQQLLAAGSADIDVFQIDVVWPGILANHFIDLKAIYSRPRNSPTISRR